MPLLPPPASISENICGDWWETKHYCPWMIFFPKLDICCLFFWKFGKFSNSLWWSDLEEIIRWPWQLASQAYHHDAKGQTSIRESKYPLCPPSSGLGVLSRISFMSKIASLWHKWYPEGAMEMRTHRNQRKTKERKGRNPKEACCVPWSYGLEREMVHLWSHR